MDALHGLIPHPKFGTPRSYVAGSEEAQSGKPLAQYTHPFRPGAPPMAFSMMLGLLESMRNAVLSGHEPAPYLIAVFPDGGPILVADPEPVMELSRLRLERGPISQAFLVGGRRMAGGILLQVAEPTGRTGYRVEQFCRRNAAGAFEALPHCWREAPPFESSFPRHAQNLPQPPPYNQVIARLQGYRNNLHLVAPLG